MGCQGPCPGEARRGGPARAALLSATQSTIRTARPLLNAQTPPLRPNHPPTFAACHPALCAVAAGLRGTAPGDAADSYLGQLAAEEELRLYGFITNTRVKLVVAVDDPVVKDDEMRVVSDGACWSTGPPGGAGQAGRAGHGLLGHRPTGRERACGRVAAAAAAGARAASKGQLSPAAGPCLQRCCRSVRALWASGVWGLVCTHPPPSA